VFARTSGDWFRTARLTTTLSYPYTPLFFGYSVAISGLRALVGAPFATAGDVEVGVAYMFEAHSGGWVDVQTLRANDPAVEDMFGASVGLTSTTALVGAPGDDFPGGGKSRSAYVFERSVSTGSWIETAKISKPGLADPNLGEEQVAVSGDTFIMSLPPVSPNKAASIYRKSAGTWSEETVLVPREGSRYDGFGRSVSVAGNLLAVGSPGDDPGEAENSGAVYVYERNAQAWEQQARLTATAPTQGEQVGSAVALSGDTLVVGCPPQQYYTPPTATGHAYVFRRAGAGWNVEATLLPGDATPQRFGYAVAISGDTAIIGAPLADTNRGSRTGAAFVFVRQGGQWTQQARLVGSDLTDNDQSGTAVAIDGDTVAIGSPNYGPNSGAVYVFTWSGSSWREQAILRAAMAAPQDRLGYSVAVSGARVVAGAPGRAILPRSSGYATVFERTGSAWSEAARLTPPSPQTPGRFGTSVTLTDDGRVVAGDPSRLKAFVFASGGDSWQQTDVLDGPLAGSFGTSLSTSVDTAVVGAPSAATPIGITGAAVVFSLP